MFLRWLLSFMTISVVHAVASFFAILAIMDSGGWWFDVIAWFFFFPILLLGWAGVDVGTLDETNNLALNSLMWASVVSSLWLVISRRQPIRRRKRSSLFRLRARRPVAPDAASRPS